MSLLLAQIINGLVLGLLYGLVALGLMLVLGVMEVLNFTHGILIALGAYFALTLRAHIGYLPALLLTPFLVGIIGIVFEREAIRRVYGKDPLFGMLLTFGIAMSVEEIIRIIWGKFGYSFRPPRILTGPVNFGFMFYTRYRLFIAGLTGALLLVVWVFLEKTPYGTVIKAGASDSEMVMALGHDLRKLRTLVFAFGAALAGLAGVIGAPLWAVKPEMGSDLLMVSFVIVVLGGIGSFWGAVIGGLLVGISMSLSALIQPRFALIVPYILMAIIILVKPRGIMGLRSLLE